MFCLKRESSVKSRRKLAGKNEVSFLIFVLSLLNPILLILKNMNKRKRSLGLDRSFKQAVKHGRIISYYIQKRV